jgi:preprotein translocase subunit YajC
MKKYIYTMLLSTFAFGAVLYGQETDTVPQPSPGQSFTQTLVMIGIALVFLYLILWRPEQKRRAAMEAQRNSLKKGDKVTAMGIVGTVVRLKDQTVILRMVDGGEIEFLKAAISEILPPTTIEEGSKEKPTT